MSVYSLLQSEENPTLEQLESSLDGNLCRCTGYRPIVGMYCYAEPVGNLFIRRSRCPIRALSNVMRQRERGY